MPPEWSYEAAFVRNLGLIGKAEQQRIREARVAIVGAGGMGSAHAITLARLGVGRFTLADPDVYEVQNFNRQVSATLASLGQNKAEATAAALRQINPEAEVQVIPARVSGENAAAFFEGADVVFDGLDVFAARARRLLFHAAQARGVPVVSAGPIGFGAVWFVWAPGAMPFDRFFGIGDGQGEAEQVLRFLAGIAGQGPQLKYMQTHRVDAETGAAPSVGLAVQIAAGAAAAEFVKFYLGRGARRPLPWLFHFDPYAHHFKRYRRVLGGRDPLFRLRLWVLKRLLPGVRERVEVRTGGG
ncbi:ThiF family adenylyltransferase [Oceanithermus desulfurans]